MENMQNQNSQNLNPNPNNRPVIPAPQDVAPPSLPVIPAKAGIQNRFLPILIVAVIIVFLGAGIYLGRTFLTPYPIREPSFVVPTCAPTGKVTATNSAAIDPTANWKTYKNEKLSVELKYPSDWSIFPGNESNLEGKWSQFNLLDLKSPDIQGELVIQEGAELIVTVIKPNNETLKQFVENILKQKAAEDSSLKENYNFYGLTGYLIVNTGKTTDGKIDISREIYFEKDNLFYGIIYIINGKNKENNSKTIDKILSTFKFTENDTANLKSQVENWNSYQISDNKFLKWAKCEDEPLISQQIKSAVSGLVKVSMINIGGVNLIITDNKTNLADADIKLFQLCEAGAFYPLKTYTDKILWISSCSTGAMPTESKEKIENCDTTLNSIKKIYN